jgi:hypothetical protein
MILPLVPMVMADPEHIAHQDTVGTHGESGTENPKDVVVPGAIQKHNLLLALVVRVGTGIEDKHGA